MRGLLLFLVGARKRVTAAAGRAGRFSYDQVGLDLVFAFGCGAVRGLYMGAQGCDGGAGELEAGHLNCGERRNGDLGDVDVVEADDRKIVGYAQACAIELVQDADGGHVVGAHDGGGHLLRLRREGVPSRRFRPPWCGLLRRSMLG